MGVGVTIIILVFQVRNVSKLPSDTWLEGDKLRIQTFVIPKPGPHQYTDYPTPLPRPPPEQTPIKKTAIKKHPQGHRDLAVPSAPTALGEPAGGIHECLFLSNTTSCRTGTMLGPTQQQQAQ